MSMKGGWLGGRGRWEMEMCPDRLVEYGDKDRVRDGNGVEMEMEMETEMWGCGDVGLWQTDGGLLGFGVVGAAWILLRRGYARPGTV